MNSIINIGVSFMKAILKISAALFLYFTFTMNATAVEKLDPHTTSVEAIAAYAKANGTTVREQLLIVQRWISENIVYDIERYNQHKSLSRKALAKGEFSKATVRETLVRRKGVCEDFALLFATIAREMGIEMFVVTGSTLEGGGHAWCAAVIDNEPFLFDPTWASGSLNISTNEYSKKLKMEYFMTSPDSIQHIPSDPLWQFSEHPLKYEQAEKGERANETDNPYFNWRDTLSAYVEMDTIQKAESAFRRGIHNGKPNKEIGEELTCKALFAAGERLLSIQDKMRKITQDIESGKGRWDKESDTEQKLQALEAQLTLCEKNLNSTKAIDRIHNKDTNELLGYIADFKKTITRYRKNLEKQKREDNKRSAKHQEEMQFFNFSK